MMGVWCRKDRGSRYYPDAKVLRQMPLFRFFVTGIANGTWVACVCGTSLAAPPN
mgnify:CR=1 FL=1